MIAAHQTATVLRTTVHPSRNGGQPHLCGPWWSLCCAVDCTP
ncbi:hypothetical protein G155_00109 [Mycobacterium sp. VKM Ac-1817D]|nr:hypothetical protein G155_00109 [Mycobacterium sp. VKM Ac-1817D]